MHSNEFEALADWIHQYCQKQLVEVYGLEAVQIKGKNGNSTCYMSPEFKKKSKKKTGLVLIKGSGAVRAGVWSRAVAIYCDFYLGTMLPQVKWAVEQDMPVVVMNPIAIKNTNSFDGHCTTIWNDFIEKSEITGLNLIVHSRGGGALAKIMK